MNPTPLDLLARRFVSDHPEEAVHVLTELPARTAAAFLESCPPQLAATVAQLMTAQEWVACLRCMAPTGVASVMAEMPVAPVASALRRLGAGEREAVVRHLPAEKTRLLRALLLYDEGTAGSLMEPAVLAVPQRATARHALASVRRHPHHVRYYVYVVDELERLVGVVDLRRLMAADRDATMESIMSSDVYRLSSRARREAIIDNPGWDRVHALPVVDESNVLVGVLRYETLRRLVRGRPRRDDPGSPAAALAELFWSGSQTVAAELLASVTGRPS